MNNKIEKYEKYIIVICILGSALFFWKGFLSTSFLVKSKKELLITMTKNNIYNPAPFIINSLFYSLHEIQNFPKVLKEKLFSGHLKSIDHLTESSQIKLEDQFIQDLQILHFCQSGLNRCQSQKENFEKRFEYIVKIQKKWGLIKEFQINDLFHKLSLKNDWIAEKAIYIASHSENEYYLMNLLNQKNLGLFPKKKLFEISFYSKNQNIRRKSFIKVLENIKTGNMADIIAAIGSLKYMDKKSKIEISKNLSSICRFSNNYNLLYLIQKDLKEADIFKPFECRTKAKFI